MDELVKHLAAVGLKPTVIDENTVFPNHDAEARAAPRRTDRAHVEDAARTILAADGRHAFDKACIEMVDALRYAKSPAWWERWTW